MSNYEDTSLAKGIGVHDFVSFDWTRLFVKGNPIIATLR